MRKLARKAGSVFMALCMASTLLAGAGGKTVQAEAVNYVPNSSFEEGIGNWQITGSAAKVVSKEEDAHTGTYYVSAWSSNDYEYTLEQTFSAADVPAGTYTLKAYYESTNLTQVQEGSTVYITLTDKNNQTTTIDTDEISTTDVHKEFTEIKLDNIQIKDDVVSITVGTHMVCPGGAWVAIDDFSLWGEVVEEPTAPTTQIEADYVNDTFWKDTDGNPIYSQGGGIFEFEGKYYWYGVKYEEAEKYVNDSSKIYNTSDVFVGVTCYSSTDLKNWKYEGLVVEPDDVYNEAIMGTTTYQYSNGNTPVFGGPEIRNDAVWVGRLGVTKLEDGTYALLVQHECADEGNKIDGDSDNWSKQVLIMTADSPTGRFTWNNRINMKSYIGTSNTGDQTVFVDDDGTGWLVYSYGSGRGRMYLSKIQWDSSKEKVTLGSPYEVYNGAGREGNCMFKYNGKYYMCASDLYGWNASHGYYLVIDPGESTLEDYLKSGNYKKATNMALMDGTSDDFCHVTQTGFFYTVKGTKQDTVIFCGDRWAAFARNGLGFNQWCPLSFDENDVPYFNSLSAWNLDTTTGEWEVADGNNYVKNGSFDADRVAATDLAGWTEKAVKGTNVISNTGTTVTGKYALKLGSATEYEGSVSQVITSTPYVELPNGVYTLSANVKTTGTFDRLVMYAKSGSVSFAKPFKAAGAFKTVKVENVIVKDNKVEIGFEAIGTGSECVIDDVVFAKSDVEAIGTGKITGKVKADSFAAGKTLQITAASGDREIGMQIELGTNEQSFEINDLADGEYTVSFAAENAVVPETRTITITGGNTVALSESVLEIANNSGNLSGKVVDTESKEPLADVTVTLTKDGKVLSAQTASDGTYVINDAEVGEYAITFTKKGYAVANEINTNVAIELNKTKTFDDVEMVLNVGTVTGTLKDKDGKTVAGAVVTLRDKSNNSSRYTATTDDKGAFRFENVVEGIYAATGTTKTNPEDGWQELNAIATKVEVKSNEDTALDLQFANDLSDKIVNSTFNTAKDLSGWTNGADNAGGYRTGKNTTHGTYSLAPWSNAGFSMDTYQTIKKLATGTYVVTCWENSDYLGAEDTLYLYAKDSEGNVLARESLPANDTYETIGLVVEVTDGTLTIGVEGDMLASAWANVDDFHLGLLGEGGEIPIDPEDQAKADAVIGKINAIGTVTLESKKAIEDARSAYKKLTNDQKELVSEDILKILTDAEEAYAVLAKADEEQKNAAAVVEQINAIGKVTIGSKSAIEAARDAYDKLTEEEKKLVSKSVVDTLTAAETAYKAAEEAKKAEDARKAEESKKTVQTSAKPQKVGTVLTIGKKLYVVTNDSANAPEVAFKQTTDKKAKKVTIDANVTDTNKISYKVTSIADNAFKGNKKVTAVTIPDGVKTIGKNAFNGAKNLKKITIKSTVLKKVGKNAFKGIQKKATIKVPKKQKKAYRKLLKKKGQPSTVKIK